MKKEGSCNKAVLGTEAKRLKYEKPLFKKQGTMNFPEKIWERLNGGKFQQTCSKCHHCR